jgi:hypothetical protein
MTIKKAFPIFLGFLALATLLVSLSISAYARSPTSPRSDTLEEFSSSPRIDLTGYRHMEAVVPTAVWATSISNVYRES